jgi:hypothetical protein
MSKSTVTRLFLGSVIASVAGATVTIGSIALAVANNVIVLNGSEPVVIGSGAAAWPYFAIAFAGVLTIIGALIGGLVSWIGALLNTWGLQSKGWFVGLLLLGIFNFGCFAMIAYVIAGPDGRSMANARTAQAPLPA